MFKPANTIELTEGVTYFARGRFRNTEEIKGIGYFERGKFFWWGVPEASGEAVIYPPVEKEHFKDLLIL